MYIENHEVTWRNMLIEVSGDYDKASNGFPDQFHLEQAIIIEHDDMYRADAYAMLARDKDDFIERVRETLAQEFNVQKD